MADTSGATGQVPGAVAVRDPAANGHVAEGTVARKNGAHPNPDALVAEIEHTREDLARTIDALADRVSPASNVRLLRERLMEHRNKALAQGKAHGNKALEHARKPEVQLGAAAVGLGVAGLVLLRVWAKRRQQR